MSTGTICLLISAGIMIIVTVYLDIVGEQVAEIKEIAEEQGISRQAVHDMIRRSTKKLEEYENTLHLMARFMDLREKAVHIQKCAEEYEHSHEEHLLEEIKQISGEIIEDL